MFDHQLIFSSFMNFFVMTFSILLGNGNQFDSPSKMTNNSNLFSGTHTKVQLTRASTDDMSFDSSAKFLPPSNSFLPSNNSPMAGDSTMTAKIMEENQQLLLQQLKKMEGFEIQQQEQFRKDLEQQRKVLEFKQNDYKVAMEQQRNMTQEQILAMQERQSSLLKQQQMQAETMLKQMQSQMESEMRMKSDLLRNQLNIFSEIQSQNPMQPMDISSVLQQLQGRSEQSEKGSIANKEIAGESTDELRKLYEKKYERLNEIHLEEVKDLKECNDRLKERIKVNKDEYQKDLEVERERRLTDLARLRDDHNNNLEEIKEEHARTLEKVNINCKDLNSNQFYIHLFSINYILICY